MSAIADKLHLLETVAPNDALLASMLDKVLGAVEVKIKVRRAETLAHEATT